MEPWVCPKGCCVISWCRAPTILYLIWQGDFIWIHWQLTGSVFLILVSSSAASCVIHTGTRAWSSSYIRLAADDPGRSTTSVLTLTPCLRPQVEMVAFHQCGTMSRHRTQFNCRGVKSQSLFLGWQMARSTLSRSSSFFCVLVACWTSGSVSTSSGASWRHSILKAQRSRRSQRFPRPSWRWKQRMMWPLWSKPLGGLWVRLS